jgi:cell division protease FtsH
MQKVDQEIRNIIDQQYAVARNIIESNRDKIEAMAKALLEWETIDADQIEDIMSGRPPRPPKGLGDSSDDSSPGSSPSEGTSASDSKEGGSDAVTNPA